MNLLSHPNLLFQAFLFAIALLLSLSPNPLSAQSAADSISDESLFLQYQTGQGQIFTGVNFGLGMGVRNENVILDNGTVLADFHMFPKAGVFVADRWLAGGGFDYFTSVATFDAGDEYRLSLRALSVFSRYYLTSGLFAELSYGWGNGNEAITENNLVTSDSFTGRKITGGLGVGNFWFKRFNFEILLQYSTSTGTYRNLPGEFSLSGLKISAGVGFAPRLKK